jgi:molybdate transport system substrate-binding protein
MRRQMNPLTLSASVLLALILASCGGAATPGPSEAVGSGDGDTPAADQAAESGGEGEPAAGETSGDELVVFAAASLTDAFNELADTFEAQNPGVTVVRNYASSLQLATQIIEGADVDVYASANEKQMARVVESGRIEPPTVTFATNRLTVIVPTDNPANITSVAGLAQEGVQLVLAVPGVPARDYANQIFEGMAADPTFGSAYLDAVYNNLVSEEDTVRGVVAKVALGEADAGVSYVSDVTPEVADDVQAIPIPEEYNVIATYPIGLITDAPHPERGRAFIDFVLSEEGQAILEKWGFGAAEGG